MDFVLSYYADNVFLDDNFPNSKLPSKILKKCFKFFERDYIFLFGMKEVALLKDCQNFVGV